MGMLDVYWKLSLSEAFEVAEWRDKRIKVRVLSPEQLSRANAGNFLADEGYLTLQTRYVNDYKIDDVVKFRHKCYVITGIKRDTYEAVPQSSVIMGGRLQDITLELFEVGDMTRNLRVETPVITVDGTTATIVCGTLDAEIHYTVDGTVPSSISPLYKSEFDIGTADTIYAIALNNNRQPSKVGKWSKTT